MNSIFPQKRTTNGSFCSWLGLLYSGKVKHQSSSKYLLIITQTLPFVSISQAFSIYICLYNFMQKEIARINWKLSSWINFIHFEKSASPLCSNKTHLNWMFLCFKMWLSSQDSKNMKLMLFKNRTKFGPWLKIYFTALRLCFAIRLHWSSRISLSSLVVGERKQNIMPVLLN